MSNINPPWVSRTSPIVNGEQVKAAVTNRLPLQLQQRTDYLKAILDSIQAGQAIYARNVAVGSDVLVGHAVYWKASTQEYKPALASVSYNAQVGGFTIAESSYAVGICAFKYNATRADIIMVGLLSDFDFTNGIGAVGNTEATAGAYYLSAQTAGHYTLQAPPVGVFIAYLRGDGAAHVNPTPRDILDAHVHYALDLYAQPAGRVACPAPETIYEFTEVDPALPGWLPADDTTFQGLAPVGAKYGYNLALHPELQRLWPPLPTENAYLEMDGIGVNRAVYQVDLNGLWWFDDCYGKAPWPTEPRPCGSSSSSSSSSSVSSSSSSGAACDSGPTLEMQGFVFNSPYGKRIRLYFTKMVYKTNNTVVTRLRPAVGSPITVTSCDSTTPAETGELCLGIDLSLSITEAEPGYKVFKDVTGTTFKRGPVVEGLKAGTAISLIPLSGESETDADDYVYGKMTINAVLPGSDASEGGVELVALNGAREDSINDVFMLSMPSTIETSMTCKIVLPTEGLITDPQMQLVFWILGTQSGTLPALNLAYKRLTRPDDCTPVDLPSSDTSLTDLGSCALDDANQYVELTSDAFVVANGDEVVFTVTRLGADSDGYDGDIGILKMGYVITPQ